MVLCAQSWEIVIVILCVVLGFVDVTYGILALTVWLLQLEEFYIIYSAFWYVCLSPQRETYW